MKRIMLVVVLALPVNAMERYERMLGQIVRMAHNTGDTVLHTAAATGDLALVRFMCNETGVIKRKKNKKGNTALHLACYEGHMPVVRYLIEEQGMDPAGTNKFGENVLHHAAEGGHVDLVRYFLSKHMMDLRIKNKYGKNPCELAALKGHSSVISCCIQALGKRSRNSDEEDSRGCKKAKKGYCPVCLENVPKKEYNVTYYSCMHFVCSPCKAQLKNLPPSQHKCPICRGPLR